MKKIIAISAGQTYSKKVNNLIREKIKYLNSNKSLEEKLEKSINDNFKVNSFVSISDKNLKVVVANKEKSVTTANDIISFVSATTDGTYYVTVKFE